MAFLIGPGRENDRDAIRLSTRRGTHIPNCQNKPERAPEAMEAARGLIMDGHDGRVLRSLASSYNCMGMAFANRRTCIEPDQVPMILEEDGYVEIAQPAALMVGDVVVYERDGETTHVAVVVTNDPVP